MPSLLDLLFPKICVSCGRWGSYICANCQKKISPLPFLKCPVCEKPALDGITHRYCKTRYTPDGLFSFFRYDGPVKEAIKAIKYRYISDIVRYLFEITPKDSFRLLTTVLNSQFLPKNSFLLPIPLHPARFRFRGFNQAEVIATALSRKLKMPTQTDVLVRTRKTTPQVEMKDKKERLHNMENVFGIKKDCPMLRGNDVTMLLVDDVFTTGATIRAAASVLKRAGAKAVWAVTLAQ